MAKKKQNPTVVKQEQGVTSHTTPQSGSFVSHHHLLWIGVCLLLGLIGYYPAFSAEFVNWDDDLFTTKSELIRSFSPVSKFFTTPVAGNYHPLTMISLAVNYAISGDKPWSYHSFNILLHLGNTVLAYWLAWRLSDRKKWVAILTGIFFAIHPLHVESVAWVSERKDVLYTFFFLLGLIQYVGYSETPSWRKYLWFSSSFVLSLLSKPAAVVFPLVLLLIDYWQGRAFSFKLIAEKLPHFILALLWGLLTNQAQNEIGATQTADVYPLSTTIFFGFYSFMFYWLKLILPTQLCTFYPFPDVSKGLPPVYYMATLFFVAVMSLVFGSRKQTKVIAFSIGFFLLNIALVLQFYTVGAAICADRYAYVPSWGAFFLAGYSLHYLVETRKSISATTAYVVIGLCVIALTFLCVKQTNTWRNSKSLWEHAVSVQPSNRAYSKLGNLYQEQKNDQQALKYYTKAIELSHLDIGSLSSRGNIYNLSKQFPKAMEDYDKAVAIQPPSKELLLNRGWCHVELGQNEKGLEDLNQAISIDSVYLDAYRNRGFLHQKIKKYPEALADFKTCLRLSPDNANIACQVGIVYYELQDWRNAHQYFTEACRLSPDNALFYTNRAQCSRNLGNIADALADEQRAVQLKGKE